MTESAPPSQPAAETPAASSSVVLADQPIVARAGRYYRNMRYIMVLGILGFAVAFAYDGWVRYPERNRKLDPIEAELGGSPTETRRVELEQQRKLLGERVTDHDIVVQRRLAMGLPLVAIGYAVFFLRRSRGQIRLENDVLHVPGHPPIPISDIYELDDQLFKKKGIVDVAYETGGVRGSLRLDDFIYQQTPIDQIYDILRARRATAAPSTPAQ